MRITYIQHSAFLAEWEDIVCLFDYAGGELPEIDRDKRLCVFASHHHSDHFDPEILPALPTIRATRSFSRTIYAPFLPGKRPRLSVQGQTAAASFRAERGER